MSRVLRVVHLQRRPQPGNFSVEQIFRNVRANLPAEFVARLWECPRPSRGVWPRLVNIWQAARQRGDVLHVTGDVHYLTFFLPRARTVLTILDAVALHRQAGLRRLLLRWFWYTIPMRRAACITTISEASRRDLAALTGCPLERIAVVPVPIGDHFAPAPRELAIRPRALLIGSAWNKNFRRQIEALAGLDCDVDFVGRLDAESEAALRRSAPGFRQYRDLSDAEMLGRYHACDFLMFASTYEGFGMPIVEAQAVGRPVITSLVSSMPEVAGDAACLVDPYDVASIRAGVLRVLQDEAYRASLIARGYVNATRFTAARTTAAYAEIYRRIGTA